MRRARGWTQLELSERSGVSVRSIARFESATPDTPARIGMLVAIAQVFALPVESVFPELLAVRQKRPYRRRSA